MSSGRCLSVVVVFVAGCTAVAMGRLDDKPMEETAAGGRGDGGGSAGAPAGKELGAPCDDDDDCASGSCADDVCCDSACSGPCVLCDLFQNEGTCTVHAAGTDPEDDCPGEQQCSSSATCITPGGESCQNASTCTTGFCVDGVCCDTPCDQTCESCREADTSVPDGFCAPHLPGTDPENECSEGTCVAAGRCCGNSDPPPGGTCPAICDNGCLGGVCHIECESLAECEDAAITCPVGYDCVVDCLAEQNICRDAVIDCPAQQSCTVNCGDISHTCQRAVINCGNGPCAVMCQGGGDVCDKTVLNCGLNSCSIDCPDTDTNQVCGDSCDCTSTSDGC